MSNDLLRNCGQGFEHAGTLGRRGFVDRGAVNSNFSVQAFNDEWIDEIAFVVLNHEREVGWRMPVVGQEFNEFCQACDIGRETFLTAVGHEHDAIDTVEQLFARGRLGRGAGNADHVHARFGAAQVAEFDGQDFVFDRRVDSCRHLLECTAIAFF